jgi:hypothetical protein
MASSRELAANGQHAAEGVDFRTLLLGAWPDGAEDGAEPPVTAPPALDPADDPQWITWSDASAESAWAAIEVALTLGAVAPPRAR